MTRTDSPSQDWMSELSRELPPVEAATSSWRPATRVWLASIFAVALVFASLLSLRPDLSARLHNLPFLLQGACCLIAALLAAYSVLQLSIPGRSNLRLETAIALTLPSALALTWLSLSLERASSDPAAIRFSPSELPCTGAVLGLSLLPGTWMMIRAKRGAPTSPARTGALIGLAASTMAAAALSLHCPNDTPWHLLAWHWLLPLSIAALTGRALGRRLLRW